MTDLTEPAILVVKKKYMIELAREIKSDDIALQFTRIFKTYLRKNEAVRRKRRTIGFRAGLYF